MASLDVRLGSNKKDFHTAQLDYSTVDCQKKTLHRPNALCGSVV